MLRHITGSNFIHIHNKHFVNRRIFFWRNLRFFISYDLESQSNIEPYNIHIEYIVLKGYIRKNSQL